MATILKPSYGASAALTITALLALASDTNLLAGWSSAVIDNTSNLSVTEARPYQNGYARLSAPTYCVLLTCRTRRHSDLPGRYRWSARHQDHNVNQCAELGRIKLADTITVDATTGRVYPLGFCAALFGGHMPKKYEVYIVQNTGAALDATTQVISRGDVTQYTNI